jgi:hypothetical protein
MGINAKPSSIDAQGGGLALWLGNNNVPFTSTPTTLDPTGFPLYIEQADYDRLLKTDPWLEALLEAGIVTTATIPDTVLEALTGGNGSSDSSNSSNSNSAGAQDQTGAGSAAGAEGTGEVGNGGTEPAANGNSQDATGSGEQSPSTVVVKQNDSSPQGSGSSSDASQSSNGASVVTGDATGNGAASVVAGTTGSDAAGSADQPAPTPAPSPAPVVIPPQPTPDPAVITDPVSETSTAVAWLEEFAKTASVDAKAIINSILTYVRDMAPGKSQTPEAMQRQQMNLHVALTGAINRLDGEFKHVWGGVLRLFHEHRDGVFSERYVYRQLQNAPMNPQQRAAFQNVVNMIKLTADPQGRKVGLRQFDKTRTMQHGLTEQGRNKLLAFYKL